MSRSNAAAMGVIPFSITSRKPSPIFPKSSKV
jgi:hypothetical protein